MSVVNWKVIVETMKGDLINFVNYEISAETFYKISVNLGIGPEVRKLIKLGANRARKNGREALRRRSILVG